MKKFYILLLAMLSTAVFAQDPDHHKISAHSRYSSSENSSSKIGAGSNNPQTKSTNKQNVCCNQKQCLESGQCPHVESTPGEGESISAIAADINSEQDPYCYDVIRKDKLTLYVLYATSLNQNTIYELTDKNGEIVEGMNQVVLIFEPGFGWMVARYDNHDVSCRTKLSQVILTY